MSEFPSTPSDNDTTAATSSFHRDSESPNKDKVSLKLKEARSLPLLIDDLRDNGLEVTPPVEEKEISTHRRAPQEDETSPATHVFENPESTTSLSSSTELPSATPKADNVQEGGVTLISSSEQHAIAERDFRLQEADAISATLCLPPLAINDGLDLDLTIISPLEQKKMLDRDNRLCADDHIASTLVAREFESVG